MRARTPEPSTASARRRGRRPPAALAAVLLAALAATPTPGDAQQPRTPSEERFHASPYLPLDHWANDVLDHWIHAGRVDGLSPLTRPWRRMEVARAIREVAAARPRSHEGGWLERLRREFRPELDRLRGLGDRRSAGHLRGRFEAGGRWMSQTHRDPLRPELEGRFSADRGLDRFWFDVDGRAGPVVGGVGVGRDRLLVNDAQFPDGRVVPRNDFLLFDEQSIRFDEGYLEAQSEHASLFFGRMNRNWGLPGMHGFVRSDYGYTYDDLAYRVGTDGIFLIGSVTSFTDAGGDTTRYLTTHRIEARPADGLVLALTEATIHGGPDRSLDLGLVNPIRVWQIAEGQQNSIAQVDAWWRPVDGLAVYGSANLDATNSLGSSREIDSCCEIGGSVGLELTGLVRGWRFRAQGSAVQSLVYRTGRPWEEWSHRGIGLGWDKTDLYLGTLEAEWLGRAGLVLRPRVDVQVRGEGRFRDRLRPPREELPTFPRILVGESETTVRPAVAGRWRPDALGGGWHLDLEWDLGVNLIRDFAHEAGDDRTAFVGEVKAVLQTPSVFVELD